MINMPANSNSFPLLLGLLLLFCSSWKIIWWIQFYLSKKFCRFVWFVLAAVTDGMHCTLCITLTPEYLRKICFEYQKLVFLKKRNVMAKNTSILLGDYFENFINEEISSGRFSSASEVVRTALRLLELEEQKIKKLREEIEIGEKSEMISNFDHEAHLASLHKKYL